ncbi:IS66 family transposase zinc-finger binding domain-containing protein, partial [Legionella oakridgensis]
STPVIGIVKRQVFDIPLPKIEVTEHQAEVKYCECCNKTITAAFPAGVLAPVQYGEVIRSWSVYYQYQHFLFQKTGCNSCFMTCTEFNWLLQHGLDITGLPLIHWH